MSDNQNIFIGLYFLLGIPLLGLLGYMSDKTSKHSKQDPQGKAKNQDNDIFGTSIQFFYKAPFKFLKKNIKERNIKGILVILGFIAILVASCILGTHALGDL